MPILTSIPFRFYAVSCIMYAVKYNIIGGSLLNIAQSISDYSVSDYIIIVTMQQVTEMMSFFKMMNYYCSLQN